MSNTDYPSENIICYYYYYNYKIYKLLIELIIEIKLLAYGRNLIVICMNCLRFFKMFFFQQKMSQK